MLPSSVTDISERKLEDEKFRVLFEYSSDAQLLFDEQRGIVDCNPATVVLLRYPDKAALLGLPPARLSPEFQPDGRRSMEKRLELIALARRNGYHRFEWSHLRFDGEVIPCEVTFTPVPLPGKSVLWVVCHDLTERKRTEEGFLDAAPNGMVLVDGSGRMVLVNAQIEQQFGYSKAELIGQPVEVLLPERYRAQHPAHRAGFLASPQKRAMGVGRDLVGRRHDGSEFPVELGLSPLPSDEGHHVLASVIDISARKQAEQDLRRSADELARSNAELEQFAYVASHDLREPLRMVQSFCGLLKDRYGDKLDEPANQYIDFAVDGAVRMQRLVDDLLEFARVGRSNERLESVGLDDVVRQALTHLAAAIVESGATIEFDRLPTVRGDAPRLRQVFQNLISNAIKFRGVDPPAIRVTACREAEDWRITVADNGIGIDPKHFQRLFVVFQRLHAKEEYPGTGIGLALCKRIVELHGGRIWLDSQPGRGTSFHFCLLPAEGPSLDIDGKEPECTLQGATT